MHDPSHKLNNKNSSSTKKKTKTLETKREQKYYA